MLRSGRHALRVHGWPLLESRHSGGKMKVVDVAAKSPPKGKDRSEPEHYFEDVLEAARLIDGQCSKNIMFE